MVLYCIPPFGPTWQLMRGQHHEAVVSKAAQTGFGLTVSDAWMYLSLSLYGLN